jgi:hypothetical protein
MFGWFKKKPSEKELFGQLAAASAKRRASQNRNCDDDMKTLLEHALQLATFFLEGGQLMTFLPIREGFAPFGVGISGTSPDGEVLDFNCLPVPGGNGAIGVHCLPDQLAMFGDAKEECLETPYDEGPPLEAFARGMKQFAPQGVFHAAGLVDRVDNPPGHQGERAIRVQLEHIEAEPITYYCTYRMKDKKLARGDMLKAAGRPFLFPRSPKEKS